MEMASTIPEKVYLDEPSLESTKNDESKTETAAEIKISYGKTVKDILSTIDNSQSLKEYEQMLERFQDYENKKYIAEYCNTKKETPVTDKDVTDNNVDDPSFRGFEDIFEALECFVHQSSLFKPERNNNKADTSETEGQGSKKNSDIIVKDTTTNSPKEMSSFVLNSTEIDSIKMEKVIESAYQTTNDSRKMVIYNVSANKRDDDDQGNQNLEEETSFIINPAKISDNVIAKITEDELDDFVDFEFDNEHDDHNTIVVKKEDDKWENVPVEVVVHNPEIYATDNVVAAPRPRLFSTFDLIKSIFKVFCCIPEEGEEYFIEHRPFGLSFQEWMILAVSVIVFIGCCIVIAVVGLRYKDCARISMSQAGTIKNLLNDKQTLIGFVESVKDYNATLYNLVKNGIIKEWDN